MTPIATKELFIANRKRFIEEMKNNAIAIFSSNHEVPSNGDALYPYAQNSDLLWLCGISQAHTYYVVIKKKNTTEEFLFIKKPDPLKEIWNGKFLSVEEAQQSCGIKQVMYSENFFAFLQVKINTVDIVYLNTNENDRKDGHYESEAYQFIQLIKQRYPLHQYERCAKILKQLRAVKTKYELQLIEHAIHITDTAFKKVLQFAQAGCYEYEIQAELIYHFLKQKSAGFAFQPIIASGDNARILHYISNEKQCKAGDLILIDFGATYQNYHADITRTIPVSGKFSARQKEIYTACLHLHRYAMSLLKPGALLPAYTDAVGKEANKVFLKLGLLQPGDIKNEDKTNPAYRKYLYHGISHHLGLDVHDFADREAPLEEGMVLTVEPGIYIAEEKIGIRLENNIVITKTGNRNLSKNIPIEVEDIETWMQAKKNA